MAATTAQFPDHASQLASFLLTNYLAQLGDRRFTSEEQFELRMKLDYHLWKLEDQAPKAAYLIIRVIDQVFAGDLDTTVFSAIDWYLDFLSGKNRQWLEEVNQGQLVRFWRTLPVRRLRDRALQTLLLIEATTIADHPDQSQIARLFGDDIGIGTDGNFTAEGREIADVLLREALVAPPARPGFVSLRDFSIRVLRFCLTPIGVPDPQLVERTLAFAGDVGDERREELKKLLQ